MWQVRKPAPAPTPAAEPAAATQLSARSLEDQRRLSVGDAGAFASRDHRTDLKVALHQRLLDLINLSALDQMSREQIEEETGDIIHEELAKQSHALNTVER